MDTSHRSVRPGDLLGIVRSTLLVVLGLVRCAVYFVTACFNAEVVSKTDLLVLDVVLLPRMVSVPISFNIPSMAKHPNESRFEKKTNSGKEFHPSAIIIRLCFVAVVSPVVLEFVYGTEERPGVD